MSLEGRAECNAGFGKVETKAGDECDFAKNSRAFYGYVVRVVVQTGGLTCVGLSVKVQEGGRSRLLALLCSEFRSRFDNSPHDLPRFG